MASKFWIGGGTNTNWSATPTTNWAATSGDTTRVAAPATGDDVFFDANSGSATSVLDGAISLRSLDCNGYTGTLTHNSLTLTISGDDSVAPGGVTFRLAAGMVYTPTSSSRNITFTSTSGTTTITTAGKTYGALTINGAGGTFRFADAVIVRTDSSITFTAGTIDAATNNVNVTAGFVTATGAGVRTLNAGTGTWTMTLAAGATWNMDGTNITFGSPQPILVIQAGTSSGSRTVALGTSKTYTSLTLTNTTSTVAEIAVSGTTCTITTWNITTPTVLRFSATATYTVTNALNWSGATAYNAVIVVNNNAAGVTTISSANNSTVEWCVLGGITYSGGGTMTADNSFAIGSLSGVTVNPPAGGAGGDGAHVIGG